MLSTCVYKILNVDFWVCKDGEVVMWNNKTKSQTNTHRKTKRQRDKKTNTMKWALRFGHYCSDGTSFISVTDGSSCRVPPKPVFQMLQLQIQSQIQMHIQISIQLQIRTQTHTHTQMLY